MLIVSITALKAQLKKEIGLEGGVTLLKPTITNNGGLMRNETFIGGIGGLSFKLTNKKDWFVQTGINAFTYSLWVSSAFLNGAYAEDFGDAINIPIQVGKQFKVSKSLSIATSIGVGTSFLTGAYDEGVLTFDNSLSNAGFNSPYYYKRSYNASGKTIYFNGLLTANLQLKISSKMQFTAGLNYWKGLSEMYNQNIHYRTLTTAWQQENVASNGTMLNISFGAKYALNFKR